MFKGPHKGCYLSGYAAVGTFKFDTFEKAKEAAFANAAVVGGITKTSRHYTLRAGRELRPSPSGEISWILEHKKTGKAGNPTPTAPTTMFKGPHKGCYLSGYAAVGTFKFDTFEKAKEAAFANAAVVGGITKTSRHYTLRAGRELRPSPSGEISWILSSVTTEKDKNDAKIFDGVLTKVITQNIRTKTKENCDDDGKFEKPNLPTLTHQSSEELMARWSEKPNAKSVLPVYRTAAEMICLKWEWVTHTRTLTILEFLGDEFEKDNTLKAGLMNIKFAVSTLTKVIAKAYKMHPRDVPDRRCVTTGRVLLTTLTQFFAKLEWRQPYFHMAMGYCLQLADPDSLVAKLGEICDKASKCKSAQRLGFTAGIQFSHELFISRVKKNSKSDQIDDVDRENNADGKMELKAARSMCRRAFEEYVDHHKHQAYRSAFLEPVKAYYKAVGNMVMHNDAAVHGVNWHLSGVMAAIGMRFPVVPFLSDKHFTGFATHWHARGGRVMWEEYKKPVNFGRAYEGVPAIRKLGRKGMGRTEENGIHGHVGSARQFGQGIAANSSLTRAEKWRLYVERLCYFFSWEFFCPKAIAVLMQEDAEFRAIGFREALKTIFKFYKESKKGAIDEETLLDFIYDDIKGDYDGARVNNLLHFAGITKGEVQVKKRNHKSRKPSDKKGKNGTASKKFHGSHELLTEVKKLVKEGHAQRHIFKTCRARKLGDNGEIFAAIRFAMAAECS
eukprot:jgi/Bigna1/141149/aug1.60_g15857